MNWFKEVFKSSETRAAELAAREEQIRKSVSEEIEARRVATEQAAIAAEEAAKAARAEIEAQLLREKMESSTPWFEPIIGAENATFVSERYRWNQAFIKDLIKKGHAGETDVEVFTSYLSRQDEEERQRILEEERDKKRNSLEPWVEVMSDKVDEDGRIEIQLDWNPAFIHYLRMNGFRGANEEVMVQTWLAALEKESNPEEFH